MRDNNYNYYKFVRNQLERDLNYWEGQHEIALANAESAREQIDRIKQQLDLTSG